MSLTGLAYSVGSLIPAIFLAIHSVKLAFAKTDEAQEELLSKKMYNWICKFYMGIAALMVLVRIGMHF